MVKRVKQLAVLAAFLVPALASWQAQAHAHLKVATPASGSVVASSPQQLTLTFSESLEPAFSGVIVKDAHGNKVSTEKATLAASDKKQLVVPLAQPLSAGRYDVDWHALSVDGHKTKGQYQFSVK